MSDRLRELLRQRALLQEHLAWLDREIAGASDSTTAAPAAAPTVRSSQPVPVPLPAAVPLPALPPASSAPIASALPAPPPVDVTPVAENILREYRVEPRSLQQDVRKGCLLYFVAAFVLLGLGVTVLYFAISSR